jgi:hypothetical protein
MAQTGFTPIQLYSTSTAAAAPVAGNLTNSTLGSELAINITDGKLFYKDNANAVQVIGWKVVPTTAGGTGLTTYTAGDLSYYATGTTFTKLAIGTIGQILTSTGSAPQWTTLSGVAVTTFSAGTTGFTPNSATSGAITLAGTLATTNGGTGLTSFTANSVFYASSTSAIGQSANLTFNGTTLTTTGISTSNNLTFTGTGNRIIGDFSNATASNRVAFQSSTTNGNTGVYIIPNGTATTGNLTISNNSAPDNSSIAQLFATSADVRFASTALGTGTNLPLTIYTAGAERLRVFTSGGVSIGNTTDPGATNLSVTGLTSAASFVPTGSAVPTNGMYLPAANTIGFATNSGEDMRIDSSGNVRIGTTTNMGGVLGVYNTNTSTGMNVECTNASFDTQVVQAIAARAGSTDYNLFRGVANGSVTFNVFGNGNVTNTNGSYGTISDAKVKENVANATSKLDKVMQLQVRNYNLIGDDLKQIGFVAQEFEQVFPSLIDEHLDKDADGKNLSTTTKSIKTSVLIPILVKAMQEQQAMIEELKTEITRIKS